ACCSAVLDNRDQDSDMQQELFIKLCKKRDTLHEIRNINAYIFWMAQNMVIDHLRKAAHETEYREKLIAAWKNSTTAQFYQKPEIERHIDKEHYSELFDQLIHDLTPQQQLIIKLSKKEGLSNKRIAQQLGLSPNTVKNHLHQGLKILRAQLDPDMEYTILMLLIAASVFVAQGIGA